MQYEDAPIEMEPVGELPPADDTPDNGVAPPLRYEMAPQGARDLVGEHPFLAVGAAVAAGFVIGRALRGA
jgi:hypothetical protein